MKEIGVDVLKVKLSQLPGIPRVVASGNYATPFTLLKALDESVAEYRLNMLNAQNGIPDRQGVEYETAFVGAGMRRHPNLTYIPCRLSLVPVLFRDHYLPDVVLIHTSMPWNGNVSLGTEINVLPAAIAAARKNGGLVIAQANPKMPYTYGDGELDLAEIDYLVAVDEPLTEKPSTAASDVAREIGARIATLVADGSTLQLGIGGIPDSVIEQLHKRRGLQIWTETFSDGVVGLQRSGAMEAEAQITASFVFGSRELYDWIDRNPAVRMLRTETTNDPSVIASKHSMTSINAALEVDLFDQANASHVRGQIYSGFGGSTDFIVGALHSRGGKSFMALPSWHERAKVSTIVSRISETVTSFQHSHVVTEQGIADCFGHSQKEQAFSLINRAAHPDAREALTESAIKMGLL